MAKVFFSYSHKNEADRNELEKHLAVLKRQDLIETWHDRRILAGSHFEGEIDSNLLDSNLILLLVSPDFLASDYCYSREMQKALEMRDNGLAWVMPIILDHCDWKNTPLRDLLACPQDGRPVSDYPNPNRAFNEICQDVRKVSEQMTSKLAGANTRAEQEHLNTPELESGPVVIDNVRSSNLRIKREFTDYEKDTFKQSTFEYIAKYFHNSLEELKARNPDIESIFEKETSRFHATIYRAGNEIASCGIINRVASDFLGAITFSDGKSDNGANASLNVADDGYSLFLIPVLDVTGKKDKLSQKGAAEYYWSMLVEQLQR